MDVTERIEAVESSLQPAIVVRGRPRRRMLLAERMAELNVPGVSLAVVNDGRIEWVKGYGVLEAGGSPVDGETLFQACSISKVIAATAALVLTEGGLLDLDQPVNDYLTSWRLPENEHTKQHPVTLRFLLSHRAGTSVSGVPAYEQGSDMPTLVQTLDGVPPATNPPVRVEFEPGSRFQYSGGGTTIVQQLIEDMSGEPYAAFVRDAVLRPLGMTRSFYDHPLPSNLAANAASGHRADGTMLAGGCFLQPQLAAGGLWTTPSDLARWAVAIEKSLARAPDTPLTQRMTNEMLTLAGDGPVALGPYAVGSGDRVRFFHGGSNEGYRCELTAYATLGKGAVVMTNADGGDRLCREVLNAIADVYDWPEYIIERTLYDLDPALYDRYAGTYEVNAALTLTVRREGDRLLGDAGPFGEHELLPESECDFFLQDADATVTFEVDESGAAPRLLLRAFGLELPAKRVG